MTRILYSSILHIDSAMCIFTKKNRHNNLFISTGLVKYLEARYFLTLSTQYFIEYSLSL